MPRAGVTVPGDPAAARERSAGAGAGAGSAIAWPVLIAAVAVVAISARLLPVLRSGGLYGSGTYDDGVYYSAAVGLVHGRLPYRDFLLLHPPALLLILSPFAALARLTNDATGLAVARGAWTVLGAVNAVLVCLILRRIGFVAAAFGGLGYALFYPAIYAERTTMLEGPGSTLLLLGLLILAVERVRPPLSARAVLLAGAVLGASASVKIWGALPLLVVGAWVLGVGGVRRAGQLLGGAVLAVVVLCGPFFLAAPSLMWRDVVTAQLGRSHRSVSIAIRVKDIVGFGLYSRTGLSSLLVVVAVLLFAGMIALAWFDPRTRLAALLFVVLAAFLLVNATWFLHYASLTAPPAAVAFGAAAHRVVLLLRGFAGPLGAAVGPTLVALLIAYALPLSHASFGQRFPGAALAAAVRSTPGCITSDDPLTLVEMHVLSRNLRRGCRLVVDLGGYSYTLPHPPGPPPPRTTDRAWQKVALDYLRSGTVAVAFRFRSGRGFSQATAAAIDRWPVLARRHGVAARLPRP